MGSGFTGHRIFVFVGLFLLGSQGQICDPLPTEPLCLEDEDCPEGQMCAGGVCECLPVRCTIYCPFGFAVDAEGCERCSCAPPPAYDYCETHDDCACGADRETGECAYGNWWHVEDSSGCAGFCSGSDEAWSVVCRGGSCVQVRSHAEPPFAPAAGGVEE